MTNKTPAQKILLNIDVGAMVSGFESAGSPTPAHHRIAKSYSSPLLLGPPRSDLLLEIVLHMFTEDEADLVQYCKPLRPKTAAQLGRKAGRSAEDASRVLDHLALKKMVILGYGDPRKYTLLPIVPGTFEMALMTPDLATRTGWHKRFAQLFEGLWDTDYFANYPGNHKTAPFRYLPVNGVIDSLYSAWPSDKLEAELEPYNRFAVGHCQCRVSMTLAGKGCDRSTENCVAIGPSAKPIIERGMMREISREEVLEIKRNAELEGSVTFMMNSVTTKFGNGSCSCCGCCCHGLRMIKDFSSPGVISKPHFKPVLDVEKCTVCGKCVAICPMDAWTKLDKVMSFDQARCIGCGLCVTACKFDALQLEETEKASTFADSQWAFFRTFIPGYFSNSVREWARRLLAK